MGNTAVRCSARRTTRITRSKPVKQAKLNSVHLGTLEKEGDLVGSIVG